jgi:hypothetical protein
MAAVQHPGRMTDDHVARTHGDPRSPDLMKLAETQYSNRA